MGKFKVVDQATFENMLQSNNSRSGTTVPKIRNSKYKRMTATNDFSLMKFVKPKQPGKASRKIQKRVIDVTIVPIKNKGKKRENGKKKPTRLKKSILQYRQKKREQDQIEKQLKLNDLDATENKIVPGIHSSSFREYCNCCKTNDLKNFGEKLIRELNRFQRRAHAQNEIKAKAHKRFVVGFRQAQAYLRINKIKLLIIATDCERNEGGDGNVGLDETIETIKKTCNEQKIPVVFAFRRREMAYFIYKKASISCIGILDYDGAREIFSQLMEALKCAREMYESLHLNN